MTCSTSSIRRMSSAMSGMGLTAGMLRPDLSDDAIWVQHVDDGLLTLDGILEELVVVRPREGPAVHAVGRPGVGADLGQLRQEVAAGRSRVFQVCRHESIPCV